MMDTKAFARAIAESKLAKQKLEAMKKGNIQQIIDLWSEFLIHVQRTFTKLEIATKQGASKGWFDNIRSVRSKDELLRYIHQARHADEHGIEAVTDTGPGSITGQVTMSQELAKHLKITVSSERVILKNVKNRGVIYQVPQTHLNKPLEDFSPITFATHTMNYLDAIILEANQKFIV